MNVADLSATLLSILTMTLIAGSFWFWVVVFQKVGSGETPIPQRFHRRPVRVPRFALILTLALLGMYVTGVVSASSNPPELTPERIRLLVLASMGEGIVVFILLLPSLLLGVERRTDLIRMGFRFDHLVQQIREGGLGLVAVVIPMGVMLVVTSPIRSAETEHPFLKLLRETGPGPELLFVAISAIIVAPLKEELMFRVILQSWFQEFCPGWVAIACSSVLFSAIHGFPDALALLPLAVVLGYVYQRTSSYLAVVILHALFNAYNVLATLGGNISM